MSPFEPRKNSSGPDGCQTGCGDDALRRDAVSTRRQPSARGGSRRAASGAVGAGSGALAGPDGSVGGGSNAEQFLPGGAARKCRKIDGRGIAATVGKNCIGLNRCPDVALWVLNGRRSWHTREADHGATGRAREDGRDQLGGGVSARDIRAAGPDLQACDVGWRRTDAVTRAGRPEHRGVGGRGGHGVRRCRRSRGAAAGASRSGSCARPCTPDRHAGRRR